MKPHHLFFAVIVAVFFTTCGGKNSNSENLTETDTLTTEQVDSSKLVANVAVAELKNIQSIFNAELSKWSLSFSGFNADSLKFIHKGDFEQIEYKSIEGINQFYSLYKPSIIFSPDNSQFIDLFSYGISLEKKGKKVFAQSDVDQAITLCNLQTKEWKRISFFGPSAGMEEAAWISANQFVLAGMMQNEEGGPTPMLAIGNTNNKTFYWFEATATRPASSTYESTAMKKLNIDVWE